jgi:hypothetical protein
MWRFNCLSPSNLEKQLQKENEQLGPGIETLEETQAKAVEKS